MLHLFHPALVHFSVAFLLVGACSESAGIVLRRERAERFGALLVVIGSLTLPLTLFTGYVAANTVELGDAARRLLAAHERNGWIVLAVFVAAQFWKAWRGGELTGLERWGYVGLLTTGAGFTVWGAFLGGRLVYQLGTGVSFPQ